jgi:hypothetical protein
LRAWVVLALVIFAAQAESQDTLVIRDVSVLPMDGARVLAHQNVVIAGERIVRVEPTREAPRAARVVDGRGKFLLPGLADMHVHVLGEADLPMFIGNGVLTVRDLNGSPETLDWRARIVGGSLVGPRLIVSGPMIAGPMIPWRNKVVAKTAAEAEATVLAQKAAGYDQIKIYDGISKEVFDAAIATAKRVGLLSTGHIPDSVGFAGVLASGMTGLEHLDKTVFAVFRHNLDTLGIPPIADSIKRSGMWATPTLAVMTQFAKMATGGFDSLMNRPEALASPKEEREFWTSVSSRLKGNRQLAAGVKYNPWTDFQLKLAGALARAGVPLMAGTDMPNGVMAPGYSLHDELDALAEAGLTRYQVLEAATSAPARFMRQSTDWGTVARGQRANLLLVDGNPLDRLTVLRNPAGAVVEGRWLDRAELTRMRVSSPQ